MQWPEILLIFSSKALISEMLCINEAFQSWAKGYKEKFGINCGREGKALKTQGRKISRQKLVLGNVEKNLQAA